MLSKFLHTNQHHVIALDLASDCKQNRSWTRAALQDAIMLGKLGSFPEFSDVSDFSGLFRRLVKISVSSLKSRLKKVFLDDKTLDRRFWGFANKVEPVTTLINFPCN